MWSAFQYASNVYDTDTTIFQTNLCFAHFCAVWSPGAISRPFPLKIETMKQKLEIWHLITNKPTNRNLYNRHKIRNLGEENISRWKPVEAVVGQLWNSYNVVKSSEQQPKHAVSSQNTTHNNTLSYFINWSRETIEESSSVLPIR